MSDLDLDANQAEVKRILTALSLEVPSETIADIASRIERHRKELEQEVRALRERVATLEDGIREHRTDSVELLDRPTTSIDLALWSLLDASHDQEHTDE